MAPRLRLHQRPPSNRRQKLPRKTNARVVVAVTAHVETNLVAKPAPKAATIAVVAVVAVATVAVKAVVVAVAEVVVATVPPKARASVSMPKANR